MTNWDFTERRQQTDRRSEGRSGKYDRRRNRCGRCDHFDAENKFCNYHKGSIQSNDFACPAFTAEGTSNGERASIAI